MTETPDTSPSGENKANQPPKLPRTRMYIFGLLFLIVAIGFYAGTWHRIKTAGFLGTGQPATMENLKPGSTSPASTPAK